MSIDRGPSLVEAAAYAERFRDQRVVIKLGGELLDSDAVLARLMPQIEVLYRLGLRPLLVHGGGVQVDRTCQDRGIDFEKRGGRRITSKAVLDVLVEVVGEQLNRRIQSGLEAANIPSLGFADGLSAAIACSRRAPSTDEHGDTIDWGEVGDVQGVEIKLLEHQPGAPWRVPVLPSLGQLEDGSLVNVNADSVASHLAIASGAIKLVLLTGVAGVMSHPEAAGPISELRASELSDMLGSGIASGGMRAKLQEGLIALQGGVPQVHIISGRAPFTLLRELFTREGCGSLLLPDGS